MPKGEGLFSKVLSSFSIKKDKEEIQSFTRPVKLLTDFEILVVQGDEPGKRYSLSKEPAIIGRLLTNDKRQGLILVKDKTMTVSSNQADIEWDSKKGSHVIKPRKTTNPTMINGNPVDKACCLSPGDIIEIGKVILKYQETSSVSSEEEPEKGPPAIRPSSMLPAASSTDTLLPEESHKYLLDENSSVISEDEDDSTIDGVALSGIKEGFQFIIEEGEEEGKIFNISRQDAERVLVIGYTGDRKSDIPLSEETLKNNCIFLKYEGDSLKIIMQDPLSDMIVNGFAVKEKLLEDNDLVRLGETLLKFSVIGKQEESYELEIIEGEKRGEVYPLSKNEFRLGRKSKTTSSFLKDIEFPAGDRTISRRHASIVKKEDGYYIINESKKSITLVNGVQVTDSRLLKNGDKIKLGENTLLLFRKLSSDYEGDEDYTIAPQLLKPSRKADTLPALREVEETAPIEKEVTGYDVKGDILENDGSFFIVTDEEEQQVSPVIDSVETEEEPVPSVIEAEKILEDMVLIEEGNFWIGSDEDPDSDCCPSHEIYTGAYYIDKYPVTNSKYRDFIEATGYRSQGGWESNFDPHLENHPVANVTYNDAVKYARWAGKRLPSEVEWEKAARGSDKRKYPWGNIWDSNFLNSRDYEVMGTVPVDNFTTGKSPYGVMDMMGNVWEWTCTAYSPYPTTEDVSGKGSGKVIRGGSWVNFLRFAGVTVRFEAFPDEFGPDIGFRCVRDIEG